ncbi:MAG: uracil-DNA glycosylase [Candidatus Rokuibacteriota bacterium]|nr:MAG: uracil-DNA glycosylase [Candidatus Rokubacteria bacterium]
MTPRRNRDSAARFLPSRRTLAALREAAAGCQGCNLHTRATQTVFGEGPRTAVVMMIGEQPGNDEDLAGRPFVGPAGKLLDRALAEAGLNRDEIYITNIVKHFKWKPQGKRRIHDKPNASEVEACRPWFEAELEVVRPEVLVCLGATAAQALLGRQFRISADRGKFAASTLAPRVFATVHPSSLLRIEDDETRLDEMRRFIEELTLVARAAREAAERRQAG